MNISTTNSSMELYVLKHIVANKKYNLSVITTLLPQNNEKYLSSFTQIDFTSVNKTNIKTLETIKFNTSVKLSDLYYIMSDVASKIEKIYHEGGVQEDNKTLLQIAWGYHIISNHLKELSKIVKNELTSYNKEIIRNIAIITDQDVWSCLGSILTCLASIATSTRLLQICPLCAQVVTCIPACATIFTVWWCVGCIAAGIVGCLLCAYGVYQLTTSCYQAGHCLGLW